MQGNFESQYSTAASLCYNIANRMLDFQNITNIRMKLEQFIRRHRNDISSNTLRAIKKSIKTLLEMQYQHDPSIRRREQRSPVRSRPGQHVVPLNERDANRLEAQDPSRHMIGQPALRRGQSQDVMRSINPHLPARVPQPRQPPQPAIIRLGTSNIMGPYQEGANRRLANIPFNPEKSTQKHALARPRSMLRLSSKEVALQLNSQSVQVNPNDFQLSQREGVAKLKRVPIKDLSFKRCSEPSIPPHVIYNQRRQESPQKEEERQPFGRKNTGLDQHIWENRRNLLTTEELIRLNSKNILNSKKPRLLIERQKP